MNSLAEIVTLLEDEGFVLSPKSIDTLYDIFNHAIFDEGGVEELETHLSYDEIAVLLAAAWLEIRNSILRREAD